MIEARLADYVSTITFEAMDDETIHLIKRNVLDSYAGICGSLNDTAMLGNFERYAAAADTGVAVPVWGIGRATGIADALFLNTILGRRSDLLNTYFSPNAMGVSHPSDNVSMAMTLGGWLKQDGKALLTSVYSAYMLSGIFSNYYCPERAGYDHDAPALFYTTLAIGRAMGVSTDILVEAQRIAGMFGLDVNQSALGTVTDWKHCTYASCAMRGLIAVRMAMAGFTGPSLIYEGEAGIDRVFPHADAILDPLPDLSSVVFKRWPALVFCQTPIDIAIDLTAKIADLDAIDSVTVSTFDFAVEVAGNPSSSQPTSRAGRTHSLPYCIAVALLNGTVGYADFDPPASDDARLADLVAKISVVADQALTDRYPADSACRIVVTLKDGTTLEAERAYPKGDPRDPLSDAELEAKFRTYFADVGIPREADWIIDTIWRLEEAEGLNSLLAPLQRRRI